jgi:hypothetical protein
LRLYTTDELRRRYQTAPGGDDPPTELRDGVMISREEIKAVILWRVWWERFGYYLLLIGAGAAVIAAVEGALPTSTSSGVQSPSGGSMIPVLALVVAILAVFFGPLVARANTHRQIRVTTRENWMREFREQVAQFLAVIASVKTVGPALGAAERSELGRTLQTSVQTVALLIAEKGQHAEVMGIMNRLAPEAMRPRDETDLTDFADLMTEVSIAAANVLRRERSAIAEDPGVWREVWISLGLDAVAWPAWLRRPTHGGPDLP